MKWGVRKSEYKSMNKQQRKRQREKYLNTPEGKIKKATTIGTLLGGPVAGVIAGSITAKKVNTIQKESVDKGKKFVEKHKNAKFKSVSKNRTSVEKRDDGKFETDEQKIIRLKKEGKINPKAHHIFDQDGNLFMVYFDD